ncbi:angiopoietin-related protein 7-like [Ruditapes philippinarum]|uniref:angiopoietin-related protein 7-like n=1 Tax=Ruditapes philippinarum TaxID=129788 RepID=UPI00295A99F3|nr:angiopoietin-related protein 7-like [Ruditapes philippinarum]
MAFWIVSNIVLNTLIGLSFSKERTKSGEIVMYDVAYVTEIPQRNKLVTIPHRTTYGLYKKIHRQPSVLDCLSLYEMSYVEYGVYVTQPTEGVNIDVWCDMSNGEWRLIQRRQGGSVDFYKDWDEYVDGVGTIIGE